MNMNQFQIREARAALSDLRLNAAEQLYLAKRLMEDVFVRLEPLTHPQMCVAEGYLCAATHAVDQAQQLVETWPHADLPSSFEEIDALAQPGVRG